MPSEATTPDVAPRCALCNEPFDHGCNSPFCSLACEEDAEPDHSIVDPTACACGDGFCEGCEVRS